jgi:hypothetical protein
MQLLPHSSELYSVIAEAYKVSCGPEPRMADSIVERAMRIIQKNPSDMI